MNSHSSYRPLGDFDANSNSSFFNENIHSNDEDTELDEIDLETGYSTMRMTEEPIVNQSQTRCNFGYFRKRSILYYKIAAGISLFILVIVLASVFARRKSADPQISHEDIPAYYRNLSQLNRISLPDVLYGRYRAAYPKLNLVRNGRGDPEDSFWKIEKDSVNIHYLNGSEALLLARLSDIKHPQTGIPLSPKHFELSRSHRYMLFAKEYRKRWRHSAFSKYYVFDTESKSVIPLHSEEHGILYAQWSMVKDDLVAYVYNHDIYVASMSAAADTEPKRLTFDGSSEIMNGVADWVYEEEVLSDVKAMWFSPLDESLAFIKFNDTNVDVYSMPVYNVENDPFRNQYPALENFKYPKPGRPNPQASLYIYNANEDKAEKINLPISASEEALIIFNVQWCPNGDCILIRALDRFQSSEYWLKYDVKTKKIDAIRTATKSTGWFEASQDLVFIPGKPLMYLSIVPNNGFEHLALYSLESEKPLKFLTSGSWEVKKILGFDKDAGQVLYISNEMGSTSQNLFKINLETREKMIFGKKESFYSALVTRNFVILDYLGPGFPNRILYGIGGDKIKLMEESPLKREVADIDLPRRLITKLELPVQDLDAKSRYVNAEIVFPLGFQKSRDGFYPLLVTGYWGPNSQMVTKKWTIDLKSYLASYFHEGSNSVLKKNSSNNYVKYGQPPFVVLTLDVRGSGGRGLDFRESITSHLGQLESTDIIAVVKRFLAKNSYIDKKKVGIWGWSFGGYNTAKVVQNDDDHIFSAAVSVAPVTNWLFYDSIYTERYMKSVQDNRLGYSQSAVNINDNFGKTRFMMIHGSADDNVHYQQTLWLLNQLQHYDKFLNNSSGKIIPPNLYRDHTVPDDNHSMGLTRGSFKLVHRLLINWLVDSWI